MKKLVFVTVVFAAACGLSTPNRLIADDQSPGNATAHRVQITKGPQLESATDSSAIIRWTADSVKGTSLRYGVVHYGTDLHGLSQTAKSPNRWNGALPAMIYRVQINNRERLISTAWNRSTRRTSAKDRKALSASSPHPPPANAS